LLDHIEESRIQKLGQSWIVAVRLRDKFGLTPAFGREATPPRIGRPNLNGSQSAPAKGVAPSLDPLRNGLCHIQTSS
jgi:hypothetical protein